MSDSELRAIRRKKLQELQRRLASKEEKNDQIDAYTVLNRVFTRRAWEVFNAASSQFPEVMLRIKEALVKLVLSGKVSEVSGEQLYDLLKSLNLKVRLNTEIKFAEHGKLKSIAEQLKEHL